jgi:hypothetical protein
MSKSNLVLLTNLHVCKPNRTELMPTLKSTESMLYPNNSAK